MILTAEKLLEKYQKEFNENGIVFDLKKPMIEFAQMHVDAALKATSDFKNHTDSFYEGHVWWIPSDSIINCYPKELIK